MIFDCLAQIRETSDDVLSVVPLWPLVTAAPLGGAQGHDVEVRQINLRNERSVDSWTADDSCGEGCAQLDNFDLFLPADDRFGDLPAAELQVKLSDSESDVDGVVPEPVPVQMTTTAVESLCPPVVSRLLCLRWLRCCRPPLRSLRRDLEVTVA